MGFEKASDRALYSQIVEQSVNNTAAIKVLTQLVMKHKLITEDELNEQVRREAEELKKTMSEKVSAVQD
jgi:tripartite-type tricarboxylate transporter receptor subunit TctC